MTEDVGYVSNWGTAHVLRPKGSLGAEYAGTLCGRTVRADRVIAAGYEDRCKKCEALSGPERT